MRERSPIVLRGAGSVTAKGWSLESPDIAVLDSGLVLLRFNHVYKAIPSHAYSEVRINELEYVELMIPTAAEAPNCDHCDDSDDLVRAFAVPVCPKCGRRPGRKK
jgi:hypothetical protein